MTDIERQYDYNNKWPVLLFHAGHWVLCAVVAGYVAYNRWPVDWPTLYWAVCALSLLMLAKTALLIVARLLHQHRVAFTKTCLLVPRSSWSSDEVAIPYEAITGLSTSGIRNTRRLYVTHTGGKYRIAELLLPTKVAFEDVYELLAARARASQPVGGEGSV
jgi:hypothetical protein